MCESGAPRRPNIPDGWPRGSRAVTFLVPEPAVPTRRLQPTPDAKIIAPATNQPQHFLKPRPEARIFSPDVDDKSGIKESPKLKAFCSVAEVAILALSLPSIHPRRASLGRSQPIQLCHAKPGMHDCSQRRGGAPLEAVIEASEARCVWTLQGSTFEENVARLRLQRACGFRTVGRRERIAQLRGV